MPVRDADAGDEPPAGVRCDAAVLPDGGRACPKNSWGRRFTSPPDQVSKVENGQRSPTGEFIAACDAVRQLSTGGRLASYGSGWRATSGSGPFPGGSRTGPTPRPPRRRCAGMS